jgi:hypothetical protein
MGLGSIAVPGILIRRLKAMELTVKPYMWIGDAPLPSNLEYPEVDLVCADVFDAYGRMVGSVWRVHETEWRITRTKGGQWTGEYASKDAALAALQAEGQP